MANATPSAEGDILLFVAGGAPSSVAARHNLDQALQMLEERGAARPSVAVIDVLEEPTRALKAGLIATPTLILQHGHRTIRFLGDLQDPSPLVEFLETAI